MYNYDFVNKYMLHHTLEDFFCQLKYLYGFPEPDEVCKENDELSVKWGTSFVDSTIIFISLKDLTARVSSYRNVTLPFSTTNGSMSLHIEADKKAIAKAIKTSLDAKPDFPELEFEIFCRVYF